MSVKTLLEGEIEKRFEDLGEIESGTEEYKTTVDGLLQFVMSRVHRLVFSSFICCIFKSLSNI